jgi:hypothetical protein
LQDKLLVLALVAVVGAWTLALADLAYRLVTRL